jgi:Glycosyltransferase family 87
MRSAALVLIPGVFCAVWTILAGKDVNWDLLNYHYYLPYELLRGRLDQDFFAASAQSYLSPLGYLPFYFMVSNGWHSVLASIALALVHGLSLTLLFVIARRLFAHLPTRDGFLFACLATALGAATSVFWPMVGSSFLDPLLLPPILGGLVLLIHSAPRRDRVALAGALFGAAAALKYSNTIYALAALPLAFGAATGLRSRVLNVAAFSAGAAIAVAALAGPWLALLTREFGNPVFPLMNAWFQSPDAAAVNMVSERFAPGHLSEALLFPFRMAALDRQLYSETFAPDLRLALLAALVVAVPFTRRAPPPNRLSGADGRVFGFLGVAAALWLASSSNARYGLPVLLLAGVALGRLAERLLPAPGARTALSILLAVQVAISLVAAPARWFVAEPWSTDWLPYEVPERALHEPALYLSVEVLPMAVVAPFLHPDSSFVNVSGQHSLPANSPRLRALLERYRGRVRALGRRLELVDGAPAAAAVTAYDAALRRLGYRLNTHDCFTVAWRPVQDGLSRVANRLARVPPSTEPLSVASCAVVAAAREPADLQAEARISAVFERIEKQCALLRGQTSVTEPFGTSGWLRHYNGLDARLEAFGGGIVLERYRTGELVDLGRIADWERADVRSPMACVGAP